MTIVILFQISWVQLELKSFRRPEIFAIKCLSQSFHLSLLRKYRRNKICSENVIKIKSQNTNINWIRPERYEICLRAVLQSKHLFIYSWDLSMSFFRCKMISSLLHDCERSLYGELKRRQIYLLMAKLKFQCSQCTCLSNKQWEFCSVEIWNFHSGEQIFTVTRGTQIGDGHLMTLPINEVINV